MSRAQRSLEAHLNALSVTLGTSWKNNVMSMCPTLLQSFIVSIKMLTFISNIMDVIVYTMQYMRSHTREQFEVESHQVTYVDFEHD